MGEAENIEILRRIFEDWNARRPAGPEILDPDILWDARNHPVPEIRRLYEGREGVRQFWAEWLPQWEYISADVKWMRGAGDRVVVWLDQHLVGRESGLKLDFGYGWDVIMRDGRLARVSFFEHERDALAALGGES